MNIDDLEEIEIGPEVEEEIVFSSARCKFPAVYFTHNHITFNTFCNGIFGDYRFIKVTKTTDLIIFSGIERKDAIKGYKLIDYGNGYGFYISGVYIGKVCGLKDRRCYKLYKTKDGRYCIKRYEPLEIELKERKKSENCT